MIRGIFYVLKGFFIWSCFCYPPFGLAILASICTQPTFDWRIFTLFAAILLIAVIVCDRQFKKMCDD